MNAATKLPGELGPIHFVGMGGIGMSGIAEVLMTLGYRVIRGGGAGPLIPLCPFKFPVLKQ